MRRTAVLVLAAFAMSACGGGDDPDTASDTTAATTSTTASAAEDTATTTTTGPPADDTTTTTEADDDGCANDITIAGSDIADGPVDVAMAITDEGPHPDNTVDYDAVLEGAIASYELEADPQFGLGVPVGVPVVADGDVILIYSLVLDDLEGVIEAGDVFDDAVDTSGSTAAADGTVNFIALFAGSERINPLGATTITITAIDDEQICGTIDMVARTDIQVFPTFTGTFRADRIQALEAEG